MSLSESPASANTSVLADAGCVSCLSALSALWRRILTHVYNVLDAVVDVPLTCLQCGGVRLADRGLDESPLSFIDHEVSCGWLLAPQNLALEHLKLTRRGPCRLGDPWGLGWCRTRRAVPPRASGTQSTRSRCSGRTRLRRHHRRQ